MDLSNSNAVNVDRLYLPSLKTQFEFHKGLFFLILCMLNAIAIFVYSEFLLTTEIYFQTYGEQVAMDQIRSTLELRRETNWIAYFLIPFVLLIKISFTAFCLNVGILVFQLKIDFAKLFRIALVAEFIFIFGNLIRAFWIAYVSGFETLQEVQYFYPFSLINFFSAETVQSWFGYPMITINIFEVAYMMALALGLHWTARLSYRRSLALTLSSYGVGLLIWVVFVVFISINLSL